MKIIQNIILSHKSVDARGEIKKDKIHYYGNWICEECGHNSGPVGICDSEDSTLRSMERGFKLHVEREHQQFHD